MIDSIYIERNPRTAGIVAVIVGIVCLAIGFQLALKKPLWDDEIFSQIQSIEDLSYAMIFSGEIGEGNNCPLFYAIQKVVADITSFKFPQARVPGTYVFNIRSQIIMRIMPNLFMSAAITIIFYYFLRFYSWSAAFYSFFVSCSCFMVWVYWVEARPYSLWVLLTVAQLLVFLYMIRKKEFNISLWRWLAVINIMLSLTVLFGVVQVVILSFLAWIFKQRNLKRYTLFAGLPIILGVFYYYHAPKYLFQFFDTPAELFLANISFDRTMLVLAYSLFLVYYAVYKKEKSLVLFDETEKKEGFAFLLLCILIFAATAGIMLILKISEHRGPEAFLINRRYFIYLTPIGIIATTLFSVHLVKAFKEDRWMFFNLIICFGGFLAVRCIRVYLELFSTALYMRIPT